MKSFRHYLFTKEDSIAAFSIFCGAFGIGTLGMPANFARASPVFAVIAMAFMGFANVYSSVVISKTLLKAPRTVKTFSDLGEWIMGPFGRYLVICAQMLVCLLTAAAFLVLGGNMLSALFPKAYSQAFWIAFMAVIVLPVSLTPTLKEGAASTFAGCVGTIVADVAGIAILLQAMDGHPSIPKPDVSLEQVVTTFGNLALAYGSAIVIPTVQRQHKQPERMPQVVFITLTAITLLFVVLAASGYSAVGCQISGNLLFSVFPDENGYSSIGFKSNWGLATIAYLFMQLHVTIAFAVFLHPAFYVLERLVLGMHRPKHQSLQPLDDALPYNSHETPQDLEKRSSTWSNASRKPEIENDEDDVELAEYKSAGTVFKYVLLRVVLIIVLVIVAVVLRHKFVDLSDFIGACANTILCILIPIAFHIKKSGAAMPMYEKVIAVITFIVCAVAGAYVTYKSGKALILDETAAVKFPFCKAEHQHELYYLKP